MLRLEGVIKLGYMELIETLQFIKLVLPWTFSRLFRISLGILLNSFGSLLRGVFYFLVTVIYFYIVTCLFLIIGFSYLTSFPVSLITKVDSSSIKVGLLLLILSLWALILLFLLCLSLDYCIVFNILLEIST